MSNARAVVDPRQQALENTGKVSLVAGFADSLNFGGIFMMFFKETLQAFLEETFKYFAFPAAAAFSCLEAILAWRQTHLDRNSKGNVRKGNIVSSAVKTAAALLITATVVSALAFTAVVGVIAPIAFTAIIGAKTLFHAGSALYYLGKMAATKENPEKRARYKELAVTNGVSAVGGVCATAALALVMVFGKPLMAGFGIAAAVIGMGFTAYKFTQALRGTPKAQGYQQIADEPPAPGDGQGQQKQLSQQARVVRRLSNSPNPRANVTNNIPVPQPTTVNLHRPKSLPTLLYNTTRSKPVPPMPQGSPKLQMSPRG